MSEKIPYEQVMGRMRLDIDYIAEEAYQKGFEAGQHEATTLEYQQGLDDAWKCARRLVWGTSLDEAEHMGFIVTEDSAEILRDYTVTAAMKAVELYDKKPKDEIRVGDEVEDETGEKLVIVHIDPSTKSVCAIGGDGCTYGFFADNYKKTGKHYSQVEELLKAMKGGAE